MIVATTRRLVLRRLELTDAESFLRLNSDLEVLRHVDDGPFASIDDARELLEQMQKRYARDDFGRWAVIRRDDDGFLGWCGLRPVEQEGVDLGYRLLREHWGQGYATEAAVESVRVGFEEYSLPYLLGRAAAANNASLAILKKLGFQPWLIKPQHGVDDVHHSILPRPNAPTADPFADSICEHGPLRARILQPADQLDFFMLEGNPNVLRYADGELIDYQQAGTALARHMIDARSSDAELRVFAVSSLDRIFVGTVATVRDGPDIEIGYRLLESCQGHGLGRSIAALALAVARQEYARHRITACCDLRNQVSLKIADGLGGQRMPDHDGHAHWQWEACART